MTAAPAACPTPRKVEVRDEVYLVACGARTCETCGLRWEKDQSIRAQAASGHLPEAVALITVTAPGTAYFGAKREHSRDSWASAIGGWNLSARRRWRALHLQASRGVRDLCDADEDRWRVMYRSWEYQRRGLLHVHLVLPYGTPGQRRATDAYVEALHALHFMHGFGHVLGGAKEPHRDWAMPPRVVPADSRAAARYVAKYVASIGHGKDSMGSVAKRTAKRGSILYVSPTLTRESGVTMTSLRARRRVASRYPWGKGSRALWEAACACDGVQRKRAPLTPQAVERIRDNHLRRPWRRLVDPSTGEVVEPTHAPPPWDLRYEPAPAPPRRREAVAVLAPVLLGDPRRPDLGSSRVRVVAIA